MADKSTPPPTVSNARKASMGNPPPTRTTPESTFLERVRSEVEQLMGDFMSR